jgi:hypothetical protein
VSIVFDEVEATVQKNAEEPASGGEPMPDPPRAPTLDAEALIASTRRLERVRARVHAD